MRPEDINHIHPGSMKSWRFWLNAPNFVRLYWRLFRDRRVALLPKVILVAGLAFLVSPEDLLPEVLGPLGLLGDGVILAAVLRGFIALCPRPVVEEHVRLISEGV